MIRLNEYTKTEWWDVYRQFFPNATPEEYDLAWADFCRMKAEHLAKLSTQ